MGKKLNEEEHQEAWKRLNATLKENGLSGYKYPSKDHENLALAAFQGLNYGRLEPLAKAIEAGCYGMDIVTAQTIIGLIRGVGLGVEPDYLIVRSKLQKNYKQTMRHQSRMFERDWAIAKLLYKAGIENRGGYDAAIMSVAENNPYGLTKSGIRKIWAAHLKKVKPITERYGPQEPIWE